MMGGSIVGRVDAQYDATRPVECWIEEANLQIHLKELSKPE
jgi:hypothetical protein